MSGLTDKISGRVKQAAGDLAGDAELRERGLQEERKGDAKDELARAKREADERAEEIARLERQPADGSHAGRASAGDGTGSSGAGAADGAGASDRDPSHRHDV